MDLRKDKIKLEGNIFSNTEFYYTDPKNITGSEIILEDEESNHLVKVMRHSVNDFIFVTNGEGKVYKSKLIKIEKRFSLLEKIETYSQKEKFPNITFYLPLLKSADRFEFSLEKCIELGITNFKLFIAEKSYKNKINIIRLEKISVAAMKQSLQAIKPRINFIKDLKISDTSLNIIFDQNAENKLSESLGTILEKKNINFIFGPEGGLTTTEIEKLKNTYNVYLTKNRLRAETAIVSAASILSAGS
ncbi:MAG: 16S rRNA (uracil(1498)-N(3))-methyltransferase [Ignavibacteriales bacterium]|nr:16S rRNA (uracil(1498)-N(3))-methyltransferase [Ignavibacteriales bacterium]